MFEMVTRGVRTARTERNLGKREISNFRAKRVLRMAGIVHRKRSVGELSEMTCILVRVKFERNKPLRNASMIKRLAFCRDCSTFHL